MIFLKCKIFALVLRILYYNVVSIWLYQRFKKRNKCFCVGSYTTV